MAILMTVHVKEGHPILTEIIDTTKDVDCNKHSEFQKYVYIIWRIFTGIL